MDDDREPIGQDSAEHILNLRMEPPDGRPLNEVYTIRDYLHGLLRLLWAEGEGFSPKRPYGDSGWQLDLHLALVKHGMLEGVIDEDGCLESLSHEERDRGDEIIADVIDYMCGV